MNYLVEEWGGKYQSQDISAKKGIGVEELMEKVLLEAELLDLKANPNRNATGAIIESTLDKGRGYVANVLVQNGTLRVGDIVLAGNHFGKVKAMFNERDQRIKEAGPATPALILGLNGAPTAGDTFNFLTPNRKPAKSPTSVCSCSASRVSAQPRSSPSKISVAVVQSATSRNSTSLSKATSTDRSKPFQTRSSNFRPTKSRSMCFTRRSARFQRAM